MTDHKQMIQATRAQIVQIDDKIAHIKVVLSLANTSTELGLNKYIKAAETHGFLCGQRAVFESLIKSVEAQGGE